MQRKSFCFGALENAQVCTKHVEIIFEIVQKRKLCRILVLTKKKKWRNEIGNFTVVSFSQDIFR